MDPKNLTEEMVAKAVGTPLAELRVRLSTDNEFFPTRRVWDKRKQRVIDEPCPRHKRLLGRILKALQVWGFEHPAAHGGVIGRSYITSAKQHVGAAVIITRDVKDAFPSISPPRMGDELRKLGFKPEVAKLLTSALTCRGRVPQGSPLSNVAINLYMRRLDQTMASFCGKHKLVYTRNADDLVVSVPRASMANTDLRARVSALMEAEFERLGLRVNEKKKAKLGERLAHQERRVHNVSVESPKGTKLPWEQQAGLCGLADGYIKFARAAAIPFELRTLRKRREQLQGWCSCSMQYDIAPSKHVKKCLADGDRIISSRMRKAGRLVSKRNNWWRGIPRL